jgi:RNA polymerase sigma-B factor
VYAESGKYTRNVVGTPSLTEKAAASGDAPDAKPGREAGAKHSGKLLVRMPATLHDELARAAETEGVSLNQWITSALASAVGWRTDDRPAKTTGEDAQGEAAPSLSPRVTRVALAANLAVVLIAAIAAIALLVAAWQSGF